MAKKYRLLKDVSTPNVNVPAGTIGEHDGRAFVNFKNYTTDQSTVRRHPDWFEEVVEEQPSLKEQWDQGQINWERECRKCMESPYYFATTYMEVAGKKFTTRLTEDQFNDQFFNLVSHMENVYTEKELLDAEEKAFEAGRSRIFVSYPTFSHYKNKKEAGK